MEASRKPWAVEGPESVIKRSRERAETKQEFELKEGLFREIVREKLFSQFRESLEDANYSDEQIQNFFTELSSHTSGEIEAVLSLPFELQQKFFEKNLEKIENGETTMGKLIGVLLRQSQGKGYVIGYHVSNHEITPSSDGSNSWQIIGTEKDHRNDDHPKAYYSLAYADLYREKNGKFMYLIRAETGQNSSHDRDNDGRWGRASSLSVITALDLREVDRRIEEALRKKEKPLTQEGGAASAT